MKKQNQINQLLNKIILVFISLITITSCTTEPVPVTPGPRPPFFFASAGKMIALPRVVNHGRWSRLPQGQRFL